MSGDCRAWPHLSTAARSDWLRACIIFRAPSKVSIPVACDSRSLWWVTTYHHDYAFHILFAKHLERLSVNTCECNSLSSMPMPSCSFDNCWVTAILWITAVAWVLASKLSSRNFSKSSAIVKDKTFKNAELKKTKFFSNRTTKISVEKLKC